MERKSVESSLIASVGYDAATRTLEVEFKKGAVYQYANVPPEEHTALMAASSIGGHFAGNIKGKYTHTKV